LAIVDERSYVVVYKPGYFEMHFFDLLQKTAITGNLSEPVLLKRIENTDDVHLMREQYMEYLVQISEWLSCDTDSTSLMPMLQSVYAEAERFAQNDSERQKAETILFRLETVESGSN
jgi:hypothetical protein